MPQLSRTNNSLSYLDGHTNINFSKNSITLDINYKKEIIEIRGKDILTGKEQAIHLYGNIRYRGIEEAVGQKDPEAPKGTSSNFQELTTFIKQFTYYTHESPDSVIASCILDNRSGKFSVSSNPIKGSVMFDAKSVQILGKSIVVSLSESTKFRKILGLHTTINSGLGAYIARGHYDKGFYITLYKQRVVNYEEGEYNIEFEILDPKEILDNIEISATLILVP